MNVRMLWVSSFLGLLLWAVVHSAAAAPGDAPAGQALYRQFCVSCHGSTGQGGPMAAMLTPRPRDLTETQYMAGRSDQQLFEVIQQGGAALGLSASMTAFGAQLSAAQIWDVVAYVRTLAPAVPAAARPASSPQATLSPPPTPTNAPRTDVTISRLRLSLWPEYDDPRVLVILRGEMTPRQAFPGTIALPVPRGAEIIGAGIISEQNELLVHPYEIVPGDPLDTIHLNLPSARFFVELYYNPFPANTTEKRLTYSTPATYPIELLEVDIQQPLQALSFTVEPAAMERRTDAQKFTYHQYVYRDTPAGQSRTFQIAYTKTASAPSVSTTPAARTAQKPLVSYPTRLSLSILAGAVVIFAGWAWLLGGARRPPDTAPIPPAPVASLAERLAFLLQDEASPPEQATPAAPLATPLGANFCTYCGQKLLADQRFCGACGKPITR